MKIFALRSAVFAAIFLAAGFQLPAQPAASGAAGMPGSGAPAANQVTLTTKLSPDLLPQDVLAAMQRVADWQLAHPITHRPTGWICSVGDVGMMALAGISGNPKYRDAMLAKGEANHWELAAYRGRMYHADDQCFGQVCTELYFIYRENQMIAPMRKRFDWILAHPPRDESVDSRVNRSQETWSWCDALFMAPPSWVRLYAATGDKRYLDFAVTNWWRTTDFLYDKNDHLFYRDARFFDQREPNGQKVFWSRGNGWVFAGTVRMLQYLPMNYPGRARFEQLFKQMAAKILSLQQPDGLWRASLLDPKDFPMPEASGSALFTYGLAWGVNQGLLDRVKYEPAVRKAWAGLIGCVDADGKLTHVQPAGDRPVKFNADSTAPYGGGVFLLAGSEVYRMAVMEGQPSKTGAVLPVIQFDHVPLTAAIEKLARQAGINIILDPKIGYGRPGANGKMEAEPLVTVHWTNLTARQALGAVLNNHGLQMGRKPGSKVYQVSKQSAARPTGEITFGYVTPLAVSVKNPAPFRRDCETVELNLKTIAARLDANPATDNFAVMSGVSSRILPSQVYSVSGSTNAAPDRLLFQVDLAPHETRTYYVMDASALAAVPPPIIKTTARYVPEREDDFMWENDRIAHRMFGPALETSKTDPLTSSGVDVWIKRTRRLVANQMYRTGQDYDTNWVMQDDYKVGNTRGCGGLGIWNDGKLYVSQNWHTYKIITTGPIRSEFELTYTAWDAGHGRMVSETKRISIDAGSNMTRVESTFSSNHKSPLEIGVGLAERPGENVVVPDGSPVVNSWQSSTAKGLVVQDRAEGWMAYWQPQDFAKGTTAVAVILPKGRVQEFTNDLPDLPASAFAAPTNTVQEGQPAIRNLLAIAPGQVGRPFVYYLGAGWSESGDFPNAKSWVDYVRRFAERRDQPLQVTIGN